MVILPILVRKISCKSSVKRLWCGLHFWKTLKDFWNACGLQLFVVSALDFHASWTLDHLFHLLSHKLLAEVEAQQGFVRCDKA